MKIRKLISAMLAAVICCLTAMPALAEDAAGGVDLTGHIVILHTGDSHGSAEGNLGFGRAAYAKEKLEGAGATVLLLDAGDALHGLPFADVSQGEWVVKAMNAAGYDAMTIGAHDFYLGADRLGELAGMAEFPMLVGNALKENGSSLLPGAAVIEKNNVKFGVFGLVTPEAAAIAGPEYSAGLSFGDPIETAKAQVAALEAENCTIIIALTHLGREGDGGAAARTLAEQVPGIDVIVNGGSHEVIGEGMWAGNTLIVSAGGYIENIGCVDVDPTGLTAATMLTDEDFGGDSSSEEVDRLIAEMISEQEELLAVVVGSTGVELDGSEEAVRTGETNLGNLAADAIRSAAGAQIGLIRSGSICASVPAGDISKGQLARVLSGSRYAVSMEITGEQLMKILEEAVSLYPVADGRFLQVSGMSFRFDPDRPAGSRVFEVKIGGEALEMEKTYSLAAEEGLAAGIPFVGGYGTLNEILLSYVESFESPVEPGAEGRIVIGTKPAE